jgi:hypothetical protein
MEEGMSARDDDNAAELRLAAAVGVAREQWPAPAALERVRRGVATAVAGSTPIAGPTQARLLRRSTRAAWLRGGGLALLIGAGFGGFAAWRLGSGSGSEGESVAVPARPVAAGTQSARVDAATAVAPVPALPPAVTVAQPLPPVLASTETRRKIQRARAARPAAQAARESEAPAVALDPETELALLRRALGALAAQPRESLELAAQHERDYAQGIFGQEREVIAIDALLALQRTTAAETRARRFLERYPRSAHAPRIRTLLGDDAPAGTTGTAAPGGAVGKDALSAAGRPLAKADKKVAEPGGP